MKYPDLGIALGGGGLLGVAHIGVLEVLEENGILPAIVTGTSAGSLVGALYAAGVEPSALRKLSVSLQKKDLFSWNFNPYSFIRFLLDNLRDMANFLEASPRALFSGEKISELVVNLTKKKRFNEIPVTFGVVAVDLITGKKVVFSNKVINLSPETLYFPNAPLGLAVQASCAIPGVFEPVPYRGALLADGGLAEMVPAQLARHLGSRIVVAVSLKRMGSVQEPETLIRVIQRSIDIMTLQNTQLDLKFADLVIDPLAFDASLGDFERVPELLDRGRQAAEKAIPALKKLLGINS
ncbi:MAG TPA: patatin-like phospholipase family protein [Syntrophaceticus sp.]|nr:patatin-like phospholipase family protein [Syntrophaceticus sp.]